MSQFQWISLVPKRWLGQRPLVSTNSLSTLPSAVLCMVETSHGGTGWQHCSLREKIKDFILPSWYTKCFGVVYPGKKCSSVICYLACLEDVLKIYVSQAVTPVIRKSCSRELLFYFCFYYCQDLKFFLDVFVEFTAIVFVIAHLQHVVFCKNK